MTIILRSILIFLIIIDLTSGAFLPGTGAALAAEETPNKDKVRSEVGKPLKAAQGLTTAKQYNEALTKIEEAEAVPEKTPYESYLIARTRVATAFADGQTELAAKSFTTAMTFDRLMPAEFLDITRALAVQFYRKSDYANAIVWASRYVDKGGPDPQVKVLLAQSHYLGNDFVKAAAQLQEINRADEAAGRVTAENQLQLWASCESKLKRNDGMVTVLEKLVTHYPKNDYWDNLIRQIQRNPAFSERLALDAYRLQRYAGNLDSADDLLEMAGLAMQAGFPAEAKQVIDQGYADKLMGSGADEPKYKKMQDQANKATTEDLKGLPQDEKRAEAAKTGVTPINTGFNFVLHGQFEKGIALIEKGIAKGGLKYPEDAKLKLATAYLYAGQKDKALQAFKLITGSDGTVALARLWIIRISQD